MVKMVKKTMVMIVMAKMVKMMLAINDFISGKCLPTPRIEESWQQQSF